MKIVCGIDAHQTSENLTHLVGRLGLPKAEAICATIGQLPLTTAPGMVNWPDAMLPQVLEAERMAAGHAFRRVCAAFGAYSIPCEPVFETGEPAHHLIGLAETHDADLIAIGSREVGPALSFMLGSVGRALTIGARRSLLIAKGTVEPTGPLRAVFAYDASEFCERSVDELVRLHPQGIAHIELIVVDTPDPASSPVTRLRGEGAFELGFDHRHDLLMEYAEGAARRLRAAGYDVRAACYPGQVAEIVRGEVLDSHADLVILGAQGHGWVERTLFGSVALAQAVSEPHSVLILRPKKR